MTEIQHGGMPVQAQTVEHEVDFCVVGGGLAGLCAAVEAARHGVRVALMQDRPMLGGNASSEVRMWISGAHGRDNRETGLVDELMLENRYRNPERNYSIWDSVLYSLARAEENLLLLLNCSCLACEMEGSEIRSVTGWQLSTQRYQRVRARLFADCSGDSVLAPLSGAQYRQGREGSGEFGEDIAPVEADRKTMGMSLLLQAREMPYQVPYIAPPWANRYTAEDLPGRLPDMSDPAENFWYMELGGEQDTIGDSEAIRDELLKVAYGIWDFMKNDPANREKHQNWTLDWLGFLPGRRESRRYVGDHIMTQHDVRGGTFDDVVAYGGWTMDDHDPGGIATRRPPNIFHPAPSPYGIPYRCLYSINISNLMFAGRNISVTHTALSSTRVMATCGLLGQAVGAAAAIALREQITPRQVGQQWIRKLQQMLMEDDCYLPGLRRQVPEVTRSARLECGAPHAENLRNGFDRPIGGEDNGCHLPLGQAVSYHFDRAREVGTVRIVFDSDLNLETLPPVERELRRGMMHNKALNLPLTYVPKTMTRAFTLELLLEDGTACLLCHKENHYQRLFRVEADRRCVGIRFTPLSTWGAETCHLFSLDVAEK